MAKVDDLDRLLAIARKFHSGSFFGRFEFDEGCALDWLRQLIEARNCIVLMSDRTDTLGAFQVMDVPFSRQHRMCLEVMFYGEGEAPAVLRMAEEWAREQGAHAMPITFHEGLKDPTKLYERFGYEPFERHFVKVL